MRNLKFKNPKLNYVNSLQGGEYTVNDLFIEESDNADDIVRVLKDTGFKDGDYCINIYIIKSAENNIKIARQLKDKYGIPANEIFPTIGNILRQEFDIKNKIVELEKFNLERYIDYLQLQGYYIISDAR
jgi:hypothetical protein